MTEFDVLMDSLGNATLGILRQVGIQSVCILPDELFGTALLILSLQDDSWEKRREALTRLVEVHGMFADELALDFGFSDPGVLGCHQVEREYAAA